MTTNFSHFKKFLLSLFLTPFVVSCSGLQPAHTGLFDFQGTVFTVYNKPIEGAVVKVLGWETLTNHEGRWSMQHVVACGALREHPSSYSENNNILITQDGYSAVEENFLIVHPAWFQSCQAQQTLAFETILKSVANAPKPSPKSSYRKNEI